MLEVTHDVLLEAIAEALEIMAFIPIMPLDALTEPPSACIRLMVHLKGVPNTHLQLAAPRQFGAVLAGNLLALDPGSPDCLQAADDAMKELLNVIAGLVLGKLYSNQDEMPTMGLPEIDYPAGPDAWQELTGQEDTVLVEAEGFPIGIALRSQ